jgi:hypothetical protein
MSSVTAQGAVNQARVNLGQAFIVCAQTSHHAGPKALQEYIGGLDQAKEHSFPCIRLEIEGEALFAPVESSE